MSNYAKFSALKHFRYSFPSTHLNFRTRDNSDLNLQKIIYDFEIHTDTSGYSSFTHSE